MARKISFIALLIAITVVLLWISAIMPTARIAFIAAAGLVSAAAVVEYGIGGGAFCFAGAAILGAIFVQDKGNVIIYLIFFGYYPIVKSLIERLGKLLPEWILKIILFNLALAIVCVVYYFGFLPGIDAGYSPLIVFLLGNIVFPIYDIGMTKLISLYINRISKHIRR